MRLPRLIAASVRDFGLLDTLDRLPPLLFSPLTSTRLRRRVSVRLSRDGFDAAHGTDTDGVLFAGEGGPDVTGGGHVVSRYETCSEAAIRLALDSLPADPARFTFVDLGCGKGKPLLVAATYPFRRLVGVDISPACVAAARRNLARHRPPLPDPSRVELVVGDAEDFTFPDEPLVLYLFNPFPRAVFEAVVARLEASLRRRPRAVAVVYLNPMWGGRLLRSPLFRRLPTIADRLPAAAAGLLPHERAALFVTPELAAPAPSRAAR
jgi:SAM-dependent methyltransferase